MSEPRTFSIESHSIDFVPLSKRYGTPRRLFTLWFSCNLSVLGVAVGALGVASGSSVLWTWLALMFGNAIGTIIVAAHSAQGPRLGIPQMIQSRAQFGVIGAGLPLVAVVITYLLYSAADGLVVENMIRALVPVGNSAALVLFGLVCLLIAFAGYELIHRIGAALTVVSTVFLAVAACLLVLGHSIPRGAASHASAAFKGGAFALTVTQAAAWALSYGPYVADYSRYLPPTASPTATFWYTALGCFLGSTLIMMFGAYFASTFPHVAEDPAGSVAGLFGSATKIAQLVITVGVVYGNVLNVYSAYMSTSTILSGFSRMSSIGIGKKFGLMSILVAIATGISMLTQDNFQGYFADTLNVMIYLLVPWSAINLADYYLVRKGQYNIADMFSIYGIYGAYRWNTIGVFLLGIAAQVPFMSLSFFQGPVARWVGADVAWIPGLVIPALLYVSIEGAASRRDPVMAGSGSASSGT